MTNYGELLAAVASWMDRDDLTSVLPSFVALAEEDMQRHLRVREMEQDFTATTNGRRALLPAGFLAFKTLYQQGRAVSPLQVQSVEQVNAASGAALAMYAIDGAHLLLNADAGVQGVMYQAAPALSATQPTNALLAVYPSLYLFGALRYACAYVRDGEGEMAHAAQFQQKVEAANNMDAGSRFAGALRSRLAR